MNRRQVVAQLRERVASLEAERDRERRLVDIRRERREDAWAAFRPLVWGLTVFGAFALGSGVGQWWSLW